MEKRKRPKHLHKVEKIPGMSNAFKLVSEYSIFGSGGAPREFAGKKAQEIRRKGVRKIAELWELSESAEKVLMKKWVEREPTKLPDGMMIPEYLQLRELLKEVEEDDFASVDVEIVFAEEECNSEEFDKINVKLSKSKARLAMSSMVKKKHLYLDVSTIDYKTFCRAYKAIKLCRSELGMNKRDMKSGAPESIDEIRALLAAEAQRSGLSRKEIAKRLGFKIYDEDNPSGSFTLLHKYIKMGREIARKLDKLEKYLQEATGIKV